MYLSKVKQLWEQKAKSYGILVLCVLIISGIGTWLLENSHATTPTATFEAESGTIGNCAVSLADTTASGGHAVKFGTCNPGGFVHPGVLLSKTQLDLVKSRMTITGVGSTPHASPKDASNAADVVSASSFNAMMSSHFASLSYAYNPPSQMKCLSYSTDPACDANDAIAAYTDALIFSYTGDTRYAAYAVKIMNAWSSTLKGICNDSSGTCNNYSSNPNTAFNAGNTALNTGWNAETFVPAAEIIRYTYGGWVHSDITAFSNMLTTLFLPVINHGWVGGGANWLMSFADATMSIGVFTDNHAAFNTGVMQWQAEVPSIIYMSGDKIDNTKYPNLPQGYPIPSLTTKFDSSSVTAASMVSYWHDPGSFISGLEGETCRDIGHESMGLDALSHGAETARIQGVDLYGQQQTRVVAGLETNARYNAIALAHKSSDGTTGSLSTAPVPTLCGGTMNVGGQLYLLEYEIAYNAYHNRLGFSMPYTKAFLDTVTRPAGTGKAALFSNWEELTFGQ